MVQRTKRLIRYAVMCILLSPFMLRGATVDTIAVASLCMGKDIKAVVILPDTYASNTQKRFNTVYLLHGFGGKYDDWVRKAPNLKSESDALQMIIVCADGGGNSWYIDSPVDTASRYETHITKELIPAIDSKYRTRANREGRAIAGLSMGGYGALFVGLRNAQLFIATASMSGSPDLLKALRGLDIEKKLGDRNSFRNRWVEYSVTNIIKNNPIPKIAISVDCGTEDVRVKMNREFHQQLNQLKIPHEYTERPGNHSWNYWANAIEYQLLFFSKQFSQ